MKPKTIIWYVDDVLTPTSISFYNTAILTNNRCPHPDVWTDYLWGQHIGRSEGLETTQYLEKHRIIENALPFPYTQQALSLTKQHGFNNVLLSARSWHSNPNLATQEWLDQHKLDSLVDDMHFVTVQESKEHRLKELLDTYDIFAFVEDNPYHASSVIGLVPEIYLINRSWNKSHHSVDVFKHVSTALEAAIQITQLI